MNIQFWSASISRLYIQFTNSSLSSPEQGPYMLESSQESFDELVEVNLTVIEYGKHETTLPVTIALFQIVMRPPEAPTDGWKANLSNLFGQNFLR